MKYTKNYNLNLPDLTDQYNLNHWVENTEKTDAQMKVNEDAINAETTRATQKDESIESSLNTLLSNYKQTVFDIIFPVSTKNDITTYMQAPGSLDPNVKFNKNGIVCKWVQITTEGEFIRFSGGNASAFGSGIQSEQLPNHQHEFSGSDWHNHSLLGVTEARYNDCNAIGADSSNNKNGIATPFSPNRYNLQYISRGPGYTQDYVEDAKVSISGTTTDTTKSIYVDDGENRPKNKTWQLWKRTE